MPKNIVICCDECGFANSNVIKFFSTIVVDGRRQVAFYHPGVDAEKISGVVWPFANLWTGLTRPNLGCGVMSDITECYKFLMNNYEEGDQLFVFGFGRGACTARGLTSMLQRFGLVAIGNDRVIDYICRWFQRPNRFPLDKEASFKRTFSWHCRTHFIGLWDTVGYFDRSRSKGRKIAMPVYRLVSKADAPTPDFCGLPNRLRQ